MIDTLINLFVLFISLGVHEFSHALAASRAGDDTARRLGRLTLNPMAHLDVIGMLPIVLGMPFGWAKPVPVDPSRFRNPALTMSLVAAAGPLSNLLLMLLGVIVWFVLDSVLGSKPYGLLMGVFALLKQFVTINLMLALFNMFPLYPFDGGRVAVVLLGRRLGAAYEIFMEKAGIFPLVAILMVDMLSGGMIFGFWFSIWEPLYQPLFRVFGFPGLSGF